MWVPAGIRLSPFAAQRHCLGQPWALELLPAFSPAGPAQEKVASA